MQNDHGLGIIKGAIPLQPMDSSEAANRFLPVETSSDGGGGDRAEVLIPVVRGSSLAFMVLPHRRLVADVELDRVGCAMVVGKVPLD